MKLRNKQNEEHKWHFTFMSLYRILSVKRSDKGGNYIDIIIILFKCPLKQDTNECYSTSFIPKQAYTYR